MKIVILDEATFNEMLERFQLFIQKVDILYQRTRIKGVEEWLDGEDVCRILNVKKRTLQTYRDTGRLSFSIIDRKIFYKNEDVQKLLSNSINPHKN